MTASLKPEEAVPWVKQFASIAKQYYELVSRKLQQTDIDRYYDAMLLIADDKDMLTQQMLAEKLAIDKVSSMRMIDYLSKSGYVKRRQNPDDRREYLLAVTAKGNRAIPAIRQAFQEAEQEAFCGISAEEKASFLHCVAAMRENLKNSAFNPIDIRFNKLSLNYNSQYEKQLSDTE